MLRALVLVGACFVLVANSITALSAEHAAKAPSPRSKQEYVPLPDGFLYGSLSTDNELYVDCDGTARYLEVRCRIALLAINSLSNGKSESLKLELAAIDKADEEGFSEEKRLYAKQLEWAQERLDKVTPWQRAYLKSFIPVWKQGAEAKDKATLKAAVSKLNDLQAGTCNVSLIGWREETVFRRASKHQWIANPGPGGLCASVTVQVLENDPEHPNLWKITETTVSADTHLDACRWMKKNLNKPTVYSWDVPNSIALPCRYLSF